MQILELQLAAQGVVKHHLVDLWSAVHEHLGVALAVDADKLARALNKRVRQKAKRSIKAFKVKVAARLARRRANNAKNKKGTSGAYASGGTAAAVAVEVTVAS